MWIVYSLLCALSDSIASLTNKKLVAKKQDPLAVSFFIHGFGAISMLLVGIIVGDKLLALPLKALILLIITAASAAAAGVILLYSLKKGDLSLIAPIQTITPLLILIIAIFFLNETPKPIGLLGIMLIVIGGIYLDKNPKEKLTSIMRRIVSYKPALLGVAAAALYALTSVFDKGGLQLVTVGVWIFYVYFFIFLFIFPLVIIKKRKQLFDLRKHKSLAFSSAIFSVGAIYLQLLALRTAMATYVLSIKRLSSVFAVILAYIFLDEKRALYRLRGAIVMVIGAILVGIS